LDLDSKQRVLLAIYTEYQKDIPTMEDITAEALELDIEVFGIAVEKLINEQMINASPKVVERRGLSKQRIEDVNLHGVMMSAKGLEYVEQKLSIDQTLSNKEKVDKVMESAGNWGWEQIKDIGTKVLAEMAIKAVGI